MFKTSTGLVRNVHSQIADRIGMSIIRGEIAPGEVLPSEMRICEMLEVSRPVVREAIRVLAGKGLIESRAKSGTRVRPPEAWSHLDPDVLRWRLASTDVDTYLQKLFALRYAVEPAAAAIAAEAATAEDCAAIGAALAGMDNAADNAAFVEADIAFHKAIYLATRNELFWPIAQMLEISSRQSFTIAAEGDHRKRALAEHRAVFTAIEARQPEAARAAALVLLDSSAGDLEKLRAPAPARTTARTPA
ncbi:GntR family transcriptional regulator [Alsobacter metallidurans]|uniref:GntR family transcriptional regulator n=1 Tax=Alsobacter metallidurans TaxID=340221 RepID=A0A917MIA8_9HYPH|nr:FadR/GntR family transcriptional regulator [Alsobacter metallidurans]GGH22883.1 GntR family transcriptional regulator [Alsobacter metallidurans]